MTYAERELIGQDIKAFQGLFIGRRQRFFDDLSGAGVLDNFSGRQCCQLRTGGGGSCSGDDIWLHLRGVRDDWIIELITHFLCKQIFQKGNRFRMAITTE